MSTTFLWEILFNRLSKCFKALFIQPGPGYYNEKEYVDNYGNRIYEGLVDIAERISDKKPLQPNSSDINP